MPAELRKLQVSGLDLTDPTTTGGEGPAPVAIALNPLVRLSAAKAAAQERTPPSYEQTPGTAAGRLGRHRRPGQRPADVTTNQWGDYLLHSQVTITDAGFTEIRPGTVTCTAVHTL